MSKTAKRIFAGILALVMVGSVVVSAGLFAGNKNSGRFTINYSKGLDRNGYIEKVRASDYVTLPDYENYTIPYDIAHASQASIDEQVAYIRTNFTTYEPDTNLEKLIEEGTQVNIDYVGSIDGVEFEGGSTGGNGVNVIIGVTNYIDGFLDQLIGHKAGDEFDINVTFPEDYGNEDLKGKDAVFHIVINHLVREVVPEITDDFVKESLSSMGYGESVEEFYQVLTRRIVDEQEKNYLWDLLTENYEVSEVPKKATETVQNMVLCNVANQAGQYGYALNDFLSIMGYEDTDRYLASNEEQIKERASIYMMVQAIAEKEGIIVSEDDVKRYFKEFYNTEDYSEFATIYGEPYVKMTVMMDKVLGTVLGKSRIEETAPVEDPAETPAEDMAG